MKIKMITTMAGPGIMPKVRGKVYDVPAKEAAELIKIKAAHEVGSK